MTEKIPDPTASTQTYPPYFMEVLQAHGGLEQWTQLGAMQFQLTSDGNRETHLIDLKNRKDLIIAADYTIGYDGQQVWVKPNQKAYPGESARFYHSLFFYFYAIPFVLADPGIRYEQLEPLQLQGKNYDVIGVTFGEGVGDSPEDKYRLLINPETKRLEWLLYTVTFFDGQSGEKFNALKYEDYQEHKGLLFPRQLTGYVYDNGQIGPVRYQATFGNLSLEEEQPEQQQFEKPEGAEIAPIGR